MRYDQIETRLIGCPMRDCLDRVTQEKFIRIFNEGACSHD